MHNNLILRTVRGNITCALGTRICQGKDKVPIGKSDQYHAYDHLRKYARPEDQTAKKQTTEYSYIKKRKIRLLEPTSPIKGHFAIWVTMWDDPAEMNVLVVSYSVHKCDGEGEVEPTVICLCPGPGNLHGFR